MNSGIMQEEKKFDYHGPFSFYRGCDAFNMAGCSQSLRQASFTATTVTATVTTTFVTVLIFVITVACLPVLARSSGVSQGCRLHPQEKMVSCRGVTVTLLQDFLTQIKASKATSSTANNTMPPPPLSSYNTTTTTASATTTLTPADTTITITTRSSLTLDNTTTTDTTATATPPPLDITTVPQPHISNTDITFATTESEGVGGDAKNDIEAHRQDPVDVTEVSCVGCRIPHLTPRLFATILTLERLAIVDSGVVEVIPGALSSHALTLVHLDLSYNLLRAVPDDVVNLTRLQVLDLRHNELHEVPDGTVLTPLHDLRHLYLDHNQLGQTLTSSQGQGSRLSVFDLWATEDTPPLARLSYLGLSLNNIKEVPRGAFSRLASLIFLDLSDNLLTSLQSSDIPSSILELDLRGNPWKCTCETTWILERYASLLPISSSIPPSAPPLSSASVSSTTTTTNADAAIIAVPLATIIFPTCSYPLHLHNRRLDTLTASAVCPSEGDAGKDEVVYVGDDAPGTLRKAFRALRLLNATSLTTHALLISWKVDAGFYALNAPPFEPLSWAVTVRRDRQGPREARMTRLRLDMYQKEQPHWAHGNGLFAEVLEDLDPGTGYVVCLTVVQQHRLYTRPSHCLHGATLLTPQTDDIPPAATKSEALQSYSTRDYFIRTEAFTVWTESRSASLSWNVTVVPKKGHSSTMILPENLLLRPLGWRVTFRRFGEEEKAEENQEVVLVSRGGEPLQNFTNHYSIEGLQPGKGYIFCLHTLTDDEVSESMAEDVSMDEPPQHPVGALSWKTTPYPQPSSARGRSVVDSKGGAGRQHFDEALPLPPQQPQVTVSPTSRSPDLNMHRLPPGSDSLLNAPTTDSDHAIVHNLPPQASTTSASSNFPPIPPSFSPLPANRPPRPPPAQSGGGFVYTSTGLRIPMPSASSGLLPPFNVLPPVSAHESGSQRGLPSEPAATRPPSRQRYIYEFEETSPEPTSPLPPSSSSERQIYTYQTRRRREVEGRRQQSSEAAPLCREVITPVELDVVLPAAIAGTVSCATTVVVVLLVCCCCWPRRCCRRKSYWRSRSATDSRKVNTISAPTPVTVFSGHTAVMAGAGAGRGDGAPLTTNRETSDGPEKAGRSISATTSSGYLTPLRSSDCRGPQNQNPDPKAAYRSLMQSRLLQRHKDLPEFHPGYDIPPMASNKSLVGYDYPHPTPVNPIGCNGERLKPAATSIPPLLPSPSSSDSNYNVSVENSPDVARSPTEVNLNIPCQQPKSSGLTKSLHVAADASESANYNYINPAEAPATTAARTYLKHPPSKTRHHRFGQQQQSAEEHNGVLQPLSCSTPDLVAASAKVEEELASASTKLQLRNGPSYSTPLPGPASLPNANKSEELTDCGNLSAVLEDSESNRQEGPPISSSGSGSASKERETYHTWGGHTAKPRPSVGEVVLTGGTLIEVPEGYVVPQTPQPTPFIRLLVRGKDESKDQLLNTPTLLTSAQAEGPCVTHRPLHGSSVTHLRTQEVDHNTLVINTAMAS